MSVDGQADPDGPRLRPAAARARSAGGGIVAVEAFSRGGAIDRAWMGWGALRVLSRQDWAPGAVRDEGRVANMERLLLVTSGALDADCGDPGRHRVEAGGLLWIGAGHGLGARLANASATAPLRLVEFWLQPDRVNAPPAVASRRGGGVEVESGADAGAGAGTGWALLADGAAAAARGMPADPAVPADDGDPLPLRQRARLLAARLEPGSRLPLAPVGAGRCWLEVLEGEAVALAATGSGMPLAAGDGVGWLAGDAAAPVSVAACGPGAASLLLLTMPA